jgi:hypothetical protein
MEVHFSPSVQLHKPSLRDFYSEFINGPAALCYESKNWKMFIGCESGVHGDDRGRHTKDSASAQPTAQKV